MPPVNADTAALDSGSIATKRSANDGDGNPHGEQSKLVAISDEGKQAGGEDDHGDGSAPAPAPHVAKKMKRNVVGLGLPTEINRALATTISSASADDEGGGDVSPRLRRRRLLETKKRGVDVEEQTLALERRRLRWAAEACREESAELEKMRLENGRMRAENERLWRRLLRRRERELGVRSKREKGRDGAAEMEGEEKPVP